MAELDKTPQTPEPTEGAAPSVEDTYKARASEQGWVDLSEWDGDPADWRPAKEFLDRGELIRSIQELKRENRVIKEGVQEFKKHHERVKELAYKQALADLRAEKKKALEEGDADAVIEIDDKIAETREMQRAAENAPQREVVPAEPNPDFVRWEARNGWYRQDRAMKAVADTVANDLYARGERDVAKMLAEVDKEVRKAFPTKFENPNRAKAPVVEGASKGGGRSTDGDVYMTDIEKQIMNKILKTGAITKADYLKEFKARQSS